MAYSNAIFYIDYEGGSDAARTSLTTVTVANPSGTITRCTKVAHGLVTGACVTLSLFTAWLNTTWKITVVDADNFDLDGAVWQTTADNSGTVAPHGGSSKADAWKTILSGATAVRVAPGDTCRLMAAPNETLVGDCAWTQYSKTITLPGAVTVNIADCQTAWTASANVTVTADTSLFKENTKSMKAVIAGAFTTGKVAYFATGTLDLSAYQQVSFWIISNVVTTSSMLTLRLCSDAIGDVTVHTVTIPALVTANVNYFIPITVDFGGALNSAIASVALYADVDPGAATVYLDNIIACKASSSADSLSLSSLIGKVWNKSWVASTTYAANDIRRPTQPNRNGFCYKVTAGGGGAAGGSEPTWPQEFGATVTDGALTWTCLDLEDTWYPIQSINGTTVKLDNTNYTLGSAGRGYDGATETVATYKREAVKTTMSNSTSDSWWQPLDSGTAVGGQITFSGGWDRTSMTTQNGESWYDAQNGYSYVIGSYSTGSDYITMENISGCRHQTGLMAYSSDCWIVKNCHFPGNSVGINFAGDARSIQVVGLVVANSGNLGVYTGTNSVTGSIRNARISSSGADPGVEISASGFSERLRWRNIVCKNNTSYGFYCRNVSDTYIDTLISANNATAGLYMGYGNIYLNNSTLSDTTSIVVTGTLYGTTCYSQKNGQVADAHLITTDGGTITSATDQRHTASGISWKFRPTSTNRHYRYPLLLSLGRHVCAANTAKSFTIWTRRDSTNINGTLRVAGGQLLGIAETTVACAPTINTWVQSSALTVTSTETGVIELFFEVYDGVGTTNAFWIDDLEVT